MTQPDIEVRLDPAGQAQLLRDVKAFDAELFKALRSRIRNIGKPIAQRTVERILPEIPARGGLRARVEATAKPTISTVAGARVAGVRFVFRKPRVLADIDRRGQIPHPVFPDVRKSRRSWTWVVQTAHARLVTDSFAQNEPTAKTAIQQAVTDAVRTIHAGEVR